MFFFLHFRYETDNGISHSEQGTLRQTGNEEGGIAATGRYRYKGQNGETISVRYIADENGFRPKVKIDYLLAEEETPRASPALIASLVGR